MSHFPPIHHPLREPAQYENTVVQTCVALVYNKYYDGIAIALGFSFNYGIYHDFCIFKWNH